MNSKEKGNEGEAFVNEIVYESFMKYWCYPGPEDEKGNKKEICDLLIIFRDTAIIVSVKNYEFKDNYDRYFRRTINKAVKQIYGAERKLFLSNRDVFIQHPDKELERFPREVIQKIHRIIINLGEGVKFYPFQKETKDEKFITLFDKAAFQAIVKELDTLPDFIEYLTKREELFKDKEVLVLPGEEEDFSEETAVQFFEHAQANLNKEGKRSILLSGTEHDLLAHYLKNGRNFPEILNSEEYSGGVLQLDGSWADFLRNKQNLRRKEEDRISYFVDELVEREILNKPSNESEQLAKELLSFDRFHRRVVSKMFWDFYHAYHTAHREFFARRYACIDDVGVVFAYFTPDLSDEMINSLLGLALDSFCIYSRYESEKMILISTTTELQQFKIGMMKDIQPFSTEEEKQIMDDARKLGWFQNLTGSKRKEVEYPEEE